MASITISCEATNLNDVVKFYVPTWSIFTGLFLYIHNSTIKLYVLMQGHIAMCIYTNVMFELKLALHFSALYTKLLKPYS